MHISDSRYNIEGIEYRAVENEAIVVPLNLQEEYKNNDMIDSYQMNKIGIINLRKFISVELRSKYDFLQKEYTKRFKHKIYAYLQPFILIEPFADPKIGDFGLDFDYSLNIYNIDKTTLLKNILDSKVHKPNSILNIYVMNSEFIICDIIKYYNFNFPGHF